MHLVLLAFGRVPRPRIRRAELGRGSRASGVASLRARRAPTDPPAAEDIGQHLEPGDTLIDGGNSYYHDDIRRSKALAAKGIHYVDIGTSGGVFGLERGFCLMIGGEDEIVSRLDPLFRTIAPGVATAPRTAGRSGEPSAAEQGYLHCGPAGAGHFVKMVHNGIEYGIMAAYAEGLNILHHANAGKGVRGAAPAPGASAVKIGVRCSTIGASPPIIRQ